MGKTVVIFGPTGTAGSGAVQACLADADVSEVRAVTRRSLGFMHEKLVDVTCADFAHLSSIAAHFRDADTCLFCLGTSARNVSGEDEYRTIHVSYPLEAARVLKDESPEATFVYLSGAGTRRTSRMMWARVKAEAEDQLPEIGLRHCVSVRPAFILPVAPTGAAKWLGRPLLSVLPSLGIGAVELGRAMLRLGTDPGLAQSGATLENRELRKLAGT